MEWKMCELYYRCQYMSANAKCVKSFVLRSWSYLQETWKELSTSSLTLWAHFVCLFSSAAQSRGVGLSMVIRSRLCNWHYGVGCGWIHLPAALGHDTDVPGSLSLAVSDRRRQLADAFHVGITACSNIETKTSARLCGKIQLWVSWSLNVSLKVNCCPKFIGSDNIFCPEKRTAVFSVLPVRSRSRHRLKITPSKMSCWNNCCSSWCMRRGLFHVVICYRRLFGLCFHKGAFLTFSCFFLFF